MTLVQQRQRTRQGKSDARAFLFGIFFNAIKSFKDALTHVGQLAMLRRLAGAPVRGEDYFRARIATGHVGVAQSDPVFEFD